MLVFIMAAAATGGRSYARPPPFGCGLFHPSYYTPLHTRPILLRTVYREKIENLSFLLSLPVCVLFHNLLSLSPHLWSAQSTQTHGNDGKRHGTARDPLFHYLSFTRGRRRRRRKIPTAITQHNEYCKKEAERSNYTTHVR